MWVWYGWKGNSLDMLNKLVNAINPTTKTGVRVLTALSTVGIALLFIWCFILSIAYIDEAFSKIKVPSKIVELLLAVVVYAMLILIFSSDALYYGEPTKNLYTKIFQSEWPSRFLEEYLGVERSLAKNLWFDEFNKWRDPNHSQHQQWNDTLSRGFACRLVYYILHFLGLFFWLGCAFLVIEIILSKIMSHSYTIEKTLACRIAFVCGMAFFWSVIRASNRLKLKGPTGVWRRYNEINNRSIHWIKTHRAEFERRIREIGEGEHATE